MQSLIPVLVGLMVLPVSAIAPMAVASAASPETVASSTDAVSAPVIEQLPAPKLALASEATSFTTKLTAYNAVPEQTSNNPFVTASGAFSNPEVVAARSRDLASRLPFGTVIAIERTGYDTPSCGYSEVEHQIGYRVIADTMNQRITKTVDVLLDQHHTVQHAGDPTNPARVLGICGHVTIKVIGRIDMDDIPSTQAELARMVHESSQIALR